MNVLNSDNLPGFISKLVEKLDQRYSFPCESMEIPMMEDFIRQGIDEYLAEKGEGTDIIPELSVNSLVLYENGNATMTLALKSKPAIDTIVTLKPETTDCPITIDPESVTFTADNWNTPVTITFTIGSLDMASTYRIVVGGEGISTRKVVVATKFNEGEEKSATVVINSYHGGGGGDGAISHSYVELYNCTDEDIDLAGKSIQYYNSDAWITGKGQDPIYKLNLEGTIKARSSFFILGSLNELSGNYLNLQHQADNADQLWKTGFLAEDGSEALMNFDNKGIGFALMDTTAINTDRTVNPLEKYPGKCLDAMSSMSDDGANAPFAVGSPAYAQSKQKIIRKITPCVSYDNSKDSIVVSYKGGFAQILPAGNPYEYMNGDIEAARTLAPKCGADGPWTPEGSVDDGKVTFIHVTDSQSENEAGFDVYKNALVVAVADANPEFVIHTGDLIENTGNNTQNWTWFKDKTNEVLGDTPFYPVRGNNDTNYTGQFTFDNQCPDNNNAYYVVIDNAIFVMLDSESASTYDGQIAWAKEAIATAGCKWVIIAMHRAPYTAIVQEAEDGLPIQSKFEPFIDEVKADLVLTGHKHMYSRSYLWRNGAKATEDGTIYLMGHPMGTVKSNHTQQEWMQIKVAAGVPCYNIIEITDEKISVVAKKIDNGATTVIDQFDITKYTGGGGESGDTPENAIVTDAGDALVTDAGDNIIWG